MNPTISKRRGKSGLSFFLFISLKNPLKFLKRLSLKFLRSELSYTSILGPIIMTRGMGLHLGKSDLLLQPWSTSVSPEVHDCMDSGKQSSFKEEEGNRCQIGRSDYIICGANEKCRKVNLLSPKLLPQPWQKTTPKELSPCPGFRVGERQLPPHSMSYQTPVALKVQGRDGHHLAPLQKTVGYMSKPDTPHTPTSKLPLGTEGKTDSGPSPPPTWRAESVMSC